MNKEDLRIVFMGTPEFAVSSLKALVANGYHVVAVVTQPDKPVGRHHDTVQFSAVKQYALSIGLPVLQPERMKDLQFINALREYNADMQVVVAFRMLPYEVWSMPRFGTFNVHAALLPQYRGAAPINWAVINGESETGVTTFFLDDDIDTGRIILQKKFTIPPTANVEYVYDGLMALGAEAALETIDLILARVTADMSKQGFGEVLKKISNPQIGDDKDLRIAPKIFKETCEIDWNCNSTDINNFVRGLSPYPGAWSKLRLIDEKDCKTKSLPDRNAVMKIFEVAKTDERSIGEPGTFHVLRNKLFVNTEDNLLELKCVQMSGKKRMDAQSFLNGFQSVSRYMLESVGKK